MTVIKSNNLLRGQFKCVETFFNIVQPISTQLGWLKGI